MNHQEEVDRGAEIADSLAEHVADGNLQAARKTVEKLTSDDLVLGICFLSRVVGIAAHSAEILSVVLKQRQSAISNITEEA